MRRRMAVYNSSWSVFGQQGKGIQADERSRNEGREGVGEDEGSVKGNGDEGSAATGREDEAAISPEQPRQEAERQCLGQCATRHHLDVQIRREGIGGGGDECARLAEPPPRP